MANKNEIDAAIDKLFADAIPLLNALGDSNRQLILRNLRSDVGTSVNDLTLMMPLSRPAVSHHLKILFDLGLLRVEKQGTTRLYFVDTKKALGPIKALIAAIDSAS